MEPLRQKLPREECPAFLAFVRRKPCTACGAPAPSQAAHIRFSDAASGHINPGVGAKSNDRRCVPLCASCHIDAPDSQHRVGNERKFWARVGKDPDKIATDLWAQFQRRCARSPEKREKVIKRAASVNRAKARRDKRKYDPNQTHLAKMSRAGRLGEVEREILSLLTPTGQKKAAHVFRQVANRWPPKGSRKMQRRNLRQ